MWHFINEHYKTFVVLAIYIALMVAVYMNANKEIQPSNDPLTTISITTDTSSIMPSAGVAEVF
jgi:hypothetical protein